MLRSNVTSKINNWTNSIGFKLNSRAVESNTLTEHYFFETFNFFKRSKRDIPEKADFIYFNPYGEKIEVKSLTDLQEGFFENLSVLK
jgi:hypothetical protein